MQSNYERLGKYINIVDKRNRNLQNENLIGLSIQKRFIPSISNTIGTDMSTYRIIKTNQFAYCPVTSRNGEKITIALYQAHDIAIISQAYDVFEINDVEKLLPEFLMMWFSRPEFDRYARFMSHGSVRELFGWEELCNVLLPIPDIDKQKEIIKEYNIIINRIDLNNQLIQKIEETAQAIYKQWFVDFEFPDINGKPYKSNGGELEYNEEFKIEIPKGWTFNEIREFGKVITGKTPSSETPEHFGDSMPFVTPGDFTKYVKFAIGAERNLSSIGINGLKNKILSGGSIIVTCIGSDMGKVVIAEEECITNQQMNSIVINESYYSDYLYYKLKSISNELKSMAMGGSTMPMLSKSEFEIIKILKPDDNLIKSFHHILKPFNIKNLIATKISNASLVMKELLLSKLATIQN
jgi:type I restriction enzyme, S subunit